MTPTRLILVALLSASVIAALGCKDPARDVPAAVVGSGAPAVEGTAAEGTAAEADASAAAIAAVPTDGTAAAAVGVADGTGAQVQAAAANEALMIVPANSSIAFTASKVTASHEGSFGQFTGSVMLNGTDPTQSVISVNIMTDSITTDTPRLTEHLKTPDFFDVAQFPNATFDSTAIAVIDPAAGAPAGTTHTITGNLTMHGQTRAISFPAAVTITPESFSATAEFSINRQDFGLVYPGRPDDLIRDGIVLRLNLNIPRSAN